MSLKNNTIQQKTIELNKLVDWFDSDEFNLEMALDKFKQAETIAADIEKDLKSLKNEIQIVKQKFDSEL